MAKGGKATILLGFTLSAIAITAATGAGAGARLALWDFRQRVKVLNWAAYFGIAGTALSLAGLILALPGKRRRGLLLAVAGIVLGALAFGVPGNWYRIAKRVPLHGFEAERILQAVSLRRLRRLVHLSYWLRDASDHGHGRPGDGHPIVNYKTTDDTDTILKAVMTANTLTLTLSADPLAAHSVQYAILRAYA